MAFDSIVPDAFPNLYSDQWRLQLQQLSSRLESYVNTEVIHGEGKRFQKLGKATARQITTRFGDTDPDELPVEFRWLYVAFKDSAHIVDRREALQLGSVGSPHQAILRSQLAAAARDRDETLITGIAGTVQSGKTGGTAITFDAGQQIAVNYVHTGTPANSGLTFDKMIEVGRLFGTNDVSGQDVETQSSITVIITHNQIADLLHEQKFTSTDYAEIRRLHTGQVANLMGMTIKCVSPDLLPHDAGTDVRTCYAYARECVTFGIAENPMAWVDELPTKRHDVQLRTEWGWGCLRHDEAGVVEIACDESPA